MKQAAIIIILFTGLFFRPLTVVSHDNDTYISQTAQDACIEYGEQYGICPELLMAMIEKESSGQANAESGGCKGLMQVNPAFHKDRMERLGVTDIFDESGNILVATDYLAKLFSENVDPALALDKYNGNGKAQENYENGIISNYARRILERSAELERIHGK